MSTPDVIDRYYAAAQDQDVDALAALFTEDARVADDGQVHEGRDAIHAWRSELAAAFTYTIEVLTATEEHPGEWLVATRLEGDFAGSPVELRNRFRLSGDRIRELEIAP